MLPCASLAQVYTLGETALGQAPCVVLWVQHRDSKQLLPLRVASLNGVSSWVACDSHTEGWHTMTRVRSMGLAALILDLYSCSQAV